MKMGMNDVRMALWKAYDKERERHGYIEGKSSEGSCELIYPTIHESDSIDKFMLPLGIMIYSYALGPSRRHYIYKGEKDRKIEYYHWESPDIYKKAVEVIEGWVEEARNEWEGKTDEKR